MWKNFLARETKVLTCEDQKEGGVTDELKSEETAKKKFQVIEYLPHPNFVKNLEKKKDRYEWRKF